LGSESSKGHITGLRRANEAEVDGQQGLATLTKAFKDVQAGGYGGNWCGGEKDNKEFWAGWKIPTFHFGVLERTFPYNCSKTLYPSRACRGYVPALCLPFFYNKLGSHSKANDSIRAKERREHKKLVRKLRAEKGKDCCFSCGSSPSGPSGSNGSSGRRANGLSSA
jgi:hypothetical protein